MTKPPELSPEGYAFLEESHLTNAKVSFLAGDCSPRRYFRVFCDNKPPKFANISSFVLMDATKDPLSLRKFCKVRTLLQEHHLNVPKIYAQNQEGFALLEDFGDLTYRKCFLQGEPPEPLLLSALSVLKRVQQIDYTEYELPITTPQSAAESLKHFFTYTFEAPFQESERLTFQNLWADSLTALHKNFPVPLTLTLGDFHSENLMKRPGKGIESCGILDFQDATLGSPAFDLVNLLEDVRYPLPPAMEHKFKEAFLSDSSTETQQALTQHYELWGLHNATRIVGIFSFYIQTAQKNSLAPYLKNAWFFLKKNLKYLKNEDLRKAYHRLPLPTVQVSP
jgi:aminoglycoside/choline kinase family phosphotransferase